ncbi:hypothetical protein LINGRAHAP2_LOCUS24802 [Linum grandiflorum]
MFGYIKVEVESDSLLTVQLTEAEDIGGHPFKVLIQDINLLAIDMEGCQIRHIKREANFVADFMAKSGHLRLWENGGSLTRLRRCKLCWRLIAFVRNIGGEATWKMIRTEGIVSQQLRLQLLRMYFMFS